ncbi:accessory Sec system glycosylation chaperone GtfB [Streptococcus hyovaginalis]|uniref:accessory Sec system glycosylation chaperone GtfB n=1 Tax=Streptococcus hyovaginalis TaxID=149015 RepID=UPI002A90E95C|nr:accessory Sec system glycosylation chaperone GtfB [Streptococcus hyovaginalis]MDY5974534.1 accessory Sec system glycosylation chaperone GtfB [Streptococcus hyovaginalis]
MINLFDTYNQSSWDLHYSLIISGYNNPTIAINDDGFLPEDVTSPYLYFTGFDKVEGVPLYFNQVPVPEFWEITGTNNHGEIHDYHQKRAHIHYANPSHLRQVKAVDWYDEAGQRRLTDRYNKQGYCFSQTAYNQEGQATITSYFTSTKQEVIVENHTTGDVILNDEDQVFIFKSRAEFVIHYLKKAAFNLDRIFYNSLSTPFMVAYRLGQAGNDVLFWQEDIADQVPGNMAILLQNTGHRTTKIVVQNKDAYRKLLRLLPQEERLMVSFLGFHYPFKRQSQLTRDALIMTNSDQLEGIEELVTSLPQIQFHIGALTEMSAKLMGLGQYTNVHLYPNISQGNVNHLFQTCSLYLDINQGPEILSSLRAAFENRMVILSFAQTSHGNQYTDVKNIMAQGQVSVMRDRLAEMVADGQVMAQALVSQEQAANVETKEHYQAVIG